MVSESIFSLLAYHVLKKLNTTEIHKAWLLGQ